MPPAPSRFRRVGAVRPHEPAARVAAHRVEYLVAGRLSDIAKRFARAARGAILVETIIVVPLVTVFAAGIVEFGSIFWQRHQMQIGVRDAARYWSRCIGDDTLSSCSLAKARNMAFYGTAEPDLGKGPCEPSILRVRNWCDPSELLITPSTPPEDISATNVFTVTGTVAYEGSPVFRLLGIKPIEFTYTYQQRYIGW